MTFKALHELGSTNIIDLVAPYACTPQVGPVSVSCLVPNRKSGIFCCSPTAVEHCARQIYIRLSIYS